MQFFCQRGVSAPRETQATKIPNQRDTMLKIKISVVFTILLALLSCNFASARSPISSSENIALNVIDKPASPLVSAHLSKQNNMLIISGEVHKRNATSLNGYILLSIIGPDGRELWQKRAELTPSGLRLQRYRLFEEQGPSLPPAGSTVVITFQRLDESLNAAIFKLDTQVSFTL